jgi:hypothetical protein
MSSAPIQPVTKNQPVSNNALPAWLQAQVKNLTRHAAELRPFAREDLGKACTTSPSKSHRLAVNHLLQTLRSSLIKTSRQLAEVGKQVHQEKDQQTLHDFTVLKERAEQWTKDTERIWDFYFALFNQRHSQVAQQLLGCDRIALDCYQAVYTGLGKARPIPSPAPFSYLETGFAPATFRRGVKMTKLAQQPNPFPLVKLPYHRLVNPWTLGAIPHEVAHNLQADLGLWEPIPRAILQRLLSQGIPPSVARVWARWHKEIFADLCGLLLIGPAFVASLMDVVGNSPLRTTFFDVDGVHPTPYLRVLINLELLRRMDFKEEAQAFRNGWNQLYPPNLLGHRFPKLLAKTFTRAKQWVVDTLCFTPYRQLGDKSLAQVVCFAPKDQKIVEQAAGRLAAGNDPGIIPTRFLIGASRFALDQGLARPGWITKNFYEALARR